MIFGVPKIIKPVPNCEQTILRVLPGFMGDKIAGNYADVDGPCLHLQIVIK